MKKSFLIPALVVAVFASVSLAAEVEIENYTFTPQSVTIYQGDTVKWKNRDAVAHTTTSGSNGVPDGYWNSGYLQQDQTFSFVFDSAGTFPYFCIPHPWMTGTVVVNSKPDTTDTTSTPALDERAGNLRLGLVIKPLSVELTLPSMSQVRLVVYDFTGRDRAILADGIYSEGVHELPWPSLGPGVYFVRLFVGNSTLTRKAIEL